MVYIAVTIFVEGVCKTGFNEVSYRVQVFTQIKRA
jgi:hypothetical protein